VAPEHRADPTVAWFHCFAGISGDMALGSLLDVGADLDEVRALLRHLPLSGWGLDAEPVLRAGLAATRAHVRVVDDSRPRTYADITALLDEAGLPDRVTQRAHAIFAALARAEGRLHARPPESVHFHEVGGVDAVVDVVGTCAALEVLGVDQLWASPVATGTGSVTTSHGLLPNPAPAVMELLREAPVHGRDVAVELTTPTGAAIVAATAVGYGPLPAMTVTATGYGAGAADLDGLPNVTQVVLGRAQPGGAHSVTAGGAGQPLACLEVNVDDVTGETLAHAVAALLDAGALDAWVTPIVMKKGRPAHTVSVLADPVVAPYLSEVLTAETGSLGVRRQLLERWPAARSIDEVDVEGVPVRVKVSPGRIKAEHDDAARAARHLGRPLREVVARAEAAWRRGREDDELPNR
jgi:uncharacterized protein (TIGR00299 family) protein